MLYEYFCEKCDKVFDHDFKMGEAPETAPCKCGKQAARYYGKVGFILKGGGWPSKKSKFNAEQTRKNKDAGRRMHKNRSGTSPKIVAHDFGGGKIKEI